MTGFLTSTNNPTSSTIAGFVAYEAATCTIVQKPTGTVLMAAGDTAEIDIAALQWRYVSKRIVAGIKPPAFEPIPFGDPNLIPPPPSADHVFDVAVSLHLNDEVWRLTGNAQGFKDGLNDLWVAAKASPLFGKPGCRPVVELARGASRTWTPPNATVEQTIIRPTFTIKGWSGTAPVPAPAVIQVAGNAVYDFDPEDMPEAYENVRFDPATMTKAEGLAVMRAAILARHGKGDAA